MDGMTPMVSLFLVILFLFLSLSAFSERSLHALALWLDDLNRFSAPSSCSYFLLDGCPFFVERR